MERRLQDSGGRRILDLQNFRHDGIFGLAFSGAGEQEGDLTSFFDIFYFPDPDEDLTEKISISGAIFSCREDYRELIRSFPERPEFSAYFRTGNLSLTFNPARSALSLVIEALSSDIIISEKGIRSGRKDGSFIVAPGEAEQDMPSYDLCLPVFDIIATSCSFLLGERPSALVRRQTQGRLRIFNGQAIRGISHPEIRKISMEAEWAEKGDTKSYNVFSADEKNEAVLWTGDMESVPGIFSDLGFFAREKNAGLNSLNRSLLGIETKPQLYIVSGFLGAGKTSFIKNFLEFQAQKYLFGAVIQNELGREGLDGRLISGECRVVEMDEGCVCCSLSGNLRRGSRALQMSSCLTS